MSTPTSPRESTSSSPHRPSFTAFWKRSKQKAREALPDRHAQSDEQKAQHRRAQVRRAQVQHRQRKATYTKQLELDVSELRDQIASASRETAALQADNARMRAALGRDVVGEHVAVADVVVRLGMDGVLKKPCFSVTAEGDWRAVNFILGLEHCCWRHFDVGDSDTRERGHALMASAQCMLAAPLSVYAARESLVEPLTWLAPAPTLDSLRGLAASLNPADLELTPVQAWFELASRYGREVLMGSGVLEELQRAFDGVTRCVAFGAAIERTAFESIVARVLGPRP